MELDASEVEAVDICNESLHVLNGKYALLLMRAINQKLRVVDLQDLALGKDFLRDLSQRGLTCQVLNSRSSHFRKLNMMGEFLRIHTLNLDFSTSLTSFQEDCFSCMPNLMCLSLCETRILNLWTTIAALSKLPFWLNFGFSIGHAAMMLGLILHHLVGSHITKLIQISEIMVEHHPLILGN
ncbi:hypothetical protein RchiOBHm_Chr6g0254281 [Rosa chinensis]|uniref:DWD hypersensitive to UV-B 1 N-terminal domain-containing protein n=1 Tax=Rosa chinensis TaxID=74649 RepID=A0A2P6PLK0_ROSCH|nr:hypothetical protein RchiOBHm_Chr6g0254281 [Rosa chinensis]